MFLGEEIFKLILKKKERSTAQINQKNKNKSVQHLLISEYVSDHLSANVSMSLMSSLLSNWDVDCLRSFRRGSYEFMPFSFTFFFNEIEFFF